MGAHPSPFVGKRLATASEDKSAKVWDAETGQELLTQGGHSDAVHGVAYSPDGKRLATPSYDGTIQVYALASTNYSSWRAAA